jgi:hypothetical protein
MVSEDKIKKFFENQPIIYTATRDPIGAILTIKCGRISPWKRGNDYEAHASLELKHPIYMGDRNPSVIWKPRYLQVGQGNCLSLGGLFDLMHNNSESLTSLLVAADSGADKRFPVHELRRALDDIEDQFKADFNSPLYIQQFHRPGSENED